MTRKKKIIGLCILIALVLCIIAILLCIKTGSDNDPTLGQTEHSSPSDPTEPCVPTTSPDTTNATIASVPSDPPLGTDPTSQTDEPTEVIDPTSQTDESTEIIDSTTSPTDPTLATEPATQPTAPATQPQTQPTQPQTQPTQPQTQPIVPSTQPTPGNLRLIISPDYVEIDVGETYALAVTYNGTGTLRWGSFEPDIATVDTAGTVTGVSYGLARIYVTDGTKIVYTFINVTEPQPTTPPEDANLIFSQSSMEMDIFYAPKYIECFYDGNFRLTWTSSNPDVATVDIWGEVAPVGLGETIITATDGYVSASCTVTVKGVQFITEDGAKVVIGQTLQLQYLYSGDGTKMTWTSDDESILTVDSNGVVTGISPGGAIVFLMDDTGYQNNIVLAVITEENKATDLRESSHNGPLYDGVVKYAGDYMTFRVNTHPYGVDPRVTVQSSNPSVVSITNDYHTYYEENNITLNFNSAGTATITITSADGAVSRSYDITVKDKYDCDPGHSGLLTPEQFVACYNGVLNANGISQDYMPTGYLVLTLSPNELTWEKARKGAEGMGHHWWSIGYRHMIITFEGINQDGNYIFYERGC